MFVEPLVICELLVTFTLLVVLLEFICVVATEPGVDTAVSTPWYSLT